MTIELGVPMLVEMMVDGGYVVSVNCSAPHSVRPVRVQLFASADLDQVARYIGDRFTAARKQMGAA